MSVHLQYEELQTYHKHTDFSSQPRFTHRLGLIYYSRKQVNIQRYQIALHKQEQEARHNLPTVGRPSSTGQLNSLFIRCA